MRAYVITALLVVLVGGGAAWATEMCDDPPCTKAQIAAYERRVAKHLIRVQQERFEAGTRGQAKRAGRYDREFKRTQRRWGDARRALATASN